MKKISIDVENSYDVIISRGILKDTGELLKDVLNNSVRLALISDDVVFSLYGKSVKDSLTRAGYSVFTHIFKNGELSKNTSEFVNILEFLAENHLTRSDAVIALGGGVVGDMAGFGAACYLRGIRFIQIPTTFLAAVDSSVGGKTAVNLKSGKNLVGAFHQPSLVICDPDTLDTLESDIFSDGISESIKCGMIKSRTLFDKMKCDIKGNIEEIISDCISIKRDVVLTDEFDRGERQLLNFGHTIGHAVEKCSDYSITHGHAVAIGMAAITKAAACVGFCNIDVYDELISVLEKCGLPIKCEFSAEDIYAVSLSDKKCTQNTITLVLPEQIGRCVLKKMNTDELFDFIKKGL